MKSLYDLDRFVEAQESDYECALSEIRAGRKRTHWMWYVFPQIDGLGFSSISRHFAIKSVEEAEAYIRHPVLGPRLLTCAEAVVAIEGRSAGEIFGSPDDLKLKSCATLFAYVLQPGSVFDRLLAKYYSGERDAKTLDLIAIAQRDTPSALEPGTGLHAAVILSDNPLLHARSVHDFRRGTLAQLLPFLTHVRDLAPTEWLVTSMTTFAKTIASFLPGHFEAYARVKHRDEFTGSLPLVLTDALIENLRPATKTPDSCYFAVWEGFGGSVVPPDLEPKLRLPHRGYHVLTGPVEAARTSFDALPYLHQSANLWWPSDQAWCVATEIDLDETYIGGSRRCVESILADSRLEATGTTAGALHQ